MTSWRWVDDSVVAAAHDRQIAEHGGLDGLRDRQAKLRIIKRITRLAGGNFGDSKSVGDGISELRIHYGPGYRVYFQQRGNVVVIILCGGDKATQVTDIKNAKKIATELDIDR